MTARLFSPGPGLAALRRRAAGAFDLRARSREGGPEEAGRTALPSNLLDARAANYPELIGNGRSYAAPPLQRDDSWTREEREDIRNDILERRKSQADRHSTGSLVVEAESHRSRDIGKDAPESWTTDLLEAPRARRRLARFKPGDRTLRKTLATLALGFLPLGAPAQTPEAARADVAALTGPGTDGRAVGSEGAATARRYLLSELAAAGAAPLPGTDRLSLPFPFVSGVEPLGATLRAGGHKRFTGDQVRAFAFSETGEVRGRLFFAGYGIRVPESAGVPYDSYAGHEVEGKIVVVFRYFPESAEGDRRTALSRNAGLRQKAAAARDLGAAGLVVVTGPRSQNAGALAPDGFDIAAPGGQGILAVSITGDAAERLFAGSGISLEDAQDALDQGDPEAGGIGDLPGAGVLSVDLARTRSTGVNVVGVLPAADGNTGPPFVAIGAHYDHLGRGGSGSLAPHGAPEVHPGADDNASGVAAVLAVARRAAEASLPLPLLVGFWSGEESGLLGSNAFLRDEIGRESLLAYLNLDMVGRMEGNRLQVQAMGSSSAWPRIVERVNVRAGFDLAPSDDPYLPTDSAAFNAAGIPTLNLFTGSHPDYHRPTDTSDRLNYDDLARVAAFAEAVARQVAAADPAPDFVEVVRREEDTPARAAMRVYTGTIPEYAAEVEGLLLGGVMAGGPAEAAGLQKGDVIVEFGGRRIVTIYDYMGALEGARIGEPLTVVFLRDGERHTVTLVPAARP